MDKSYKTIKYILRNHIKSGVKSLWIWIKNPEEFNCIYESLPPEHKDERIYTAKQLLKRLCEQ